MSFSIEGKQCKVCKAYLFEDDDIVFCPECGAPHHRSCYNSLGHCALEDLHGTDKQYDSEKDGKPKAEENAFEDEKENKGPDFGTGVKVKCPMCGRLYDASEPACPDCRTPNGVKFGGRFVSFDFLGGVPADTDLGEGITADEAKQFVMSNSHRYIPKFERMKNGKKTSFNVFALLFPALWAISRKMYKLGAFLMALTVALNVVMTQYMDYVKSVFEKLEVWDEVAGNTMQMAQFMTDNPKDFLGIPFYIGMAAAVIWLAQSIIMGILGDYFYRNHTIKTIKSIKENSEDIETDMRKKGGVSLLWLILGYAIIIILPEIILSFI